MDFGEHTMIDLASERTLTIAEAAKNNRVAFSTLFRWMLHGAKNSAGQLVKLEAIRLGNRWLTSTEALQRFAERLTPRQDAPPVPLPRAESKRERAANASSKRLVAAGW